jgi:hypothetical protein
LLTGREEEAEMRIDMIYYPTDFFQNPDDDVDVEASGRTFAALLTQALRSEFPEARVNIWYNATEVHSAQDFEIHWNDGEVAPKDKQQAERGIRDRVADIAGQIRESQDWVVRVMRP